MNRKRRPRHEHRPPHRETVGQRQAPNVHTLLHDFAPHKYYLWMLDRIRRTSGPPLIGVGAVLFSADLTEVLLVQRGTAPAEGKWSVPGGLVERGERLHQACEREVLEETGLRALLRPEPVKIFERLIPTAQRDADYHYVIIDFFGHAGEGTLRAGSDVKQAAWVPLRELGGLDTTEGLGDVVERARALAREETPATPLLESW